jgi:hypothetical protein
MMYHLTYFLFCGLEICSVDDNPSSVPLEDDVHTWSYSIYHAIEYENMMVMQRLELAFAIVAYTRAEYLAKHTGISVSEFLALALADAYRTLKAISKSTSCIRSKTMSVQGVSQLSICLLTLYVFVLSSKEHGHLYGCDIMADRLQEFCAYYIIYLQPDWQGEAGEKSKELSELLHWGVSVVGHVLRQDMSDLDLDKVVRFTSS